MTETQVFSGKKFVDFDGLDYFWSKARKHVDDADAVLDKKIDDTASEFESKINNLDFVDTAVAGEYISSVSQEDGIVKITRATLPKGVTEISYITDEATGKKMIVLIGEDGKQIGEGIDASDFIADGMLTDVDLTDDDKLKFTFNVLNDPNNPDSGFKSIELDVAKYIDTYGADGNEIVLNDKVFSIKEVNASKAKIETDIQIAGGPLADNIEETNDVWPSNWVDDSGNKIIPAGASLTDIITNLFLKIIEGTVSFSAVSWSPAVANPTVTLSNTNTAEVGSKVKVTALSKGEFNKAKRSVTLTADQGYFDGNTFVNKSSDGTYTFYSAESTASGSETLTCTWNGDAVDVTVNSTELEVKEGTNTIVATQVGLTASVSAIPSKTVNAATNTKTKLTDANKNQVATLSESQETYTKVLDAKTKSDDVVGSYYYFIGTVAGTKLEIDGEMVRGLLNATQNKKNGFVNALANAGTEVLSTVTVPANGNTTIIAVPTGYTIKQILALGKDAKADWTKNGAAKKTVDVTLPNGAKYTYNVFYSENDGPADSEFSNLKLGK